MTQITVTNATIFRSIADDAFEKMTRRMKVDRRAKPDGKVGSVLTHNPEHESFKQAMISIVFTGIWLESLLHLQMVDKLGVASAISHDRKKYEEKLQVLGVADERLLNLTSRFRTIRRELVHEKAHTDRGEIRIAQTEAESAHELRMAVDAWLEAQ